MKNIISCLFLLFFLSNGFAQKRSCKIEIYLLKGYKHVEDWTGTTIGITATEADLQDTAFIKDAEIDSFVIPTILQHKLMFYTSVDVYARLSQLGKSDSRAFALVVNEKVVFAAFFRSPFSSLGTNWIVGMGVGHSIIVSRRLPDILPVDLKNDPRINWELLHCIQDTARVP